MMYILIIIFSFIITIVGLWISKDDFQYGKISIPSSIITIFGVILFTFFIMLTAGELDTLKKQNTLLIAYFIENNCSDKKIEKYFKKDIIKYKIEKYSEKLEKKD